MKGMVSSNQVFTEAQRELLAAALNRIIPPEGPLPGAGDLGLVDFVESVVGRDTRLRRLFHDGMAQVQIAAAHREGKEFSQLSAAAQDATLQEVEASLPEFFEALVRQTYNGYYTSPRIFQLIGYSPPNPQPKGYQPELLDERLLEKQRQRAPFWRQV
jgi:hypothetical protein